MPDLVDIPGVEIARAGTWRLSSGPAVFTPAKFAAAIDAINTCPAIKTPGLKLGHDYIDGVVQLRQVNRGGVPALGWVDNLRVDGDVLRGDYRGLPSAFAARQADGHSPIVSGYPNCSIEGYENAKCRLGHDHEFVITDVTLIGADQPAATLTDLRDLYGLYGIAAAHEPMGTPFSGPPLPDDAPPVVTVDDVQRIAAAATQTPEPDPASGKPNPRGAGMDPAKLREQLGLAADAPDDKVSETLAELMTRPTEVAAPATGDVVDAEALVAAAVEKATATFAAALEQTSGELASIKAKHAADEKTSFFAAALADGKLAPAEREMWEKEYDEAPGTVQRVFAAKAKGSAVPIAAAGYTGSNELPAGDFTDEDQAFLKGLAGGAV